LGMGLLAGTAVRAETRFFPFDFPAWTQCRPRLPDSTMRARSSAPTSTGTTTATASSRVRPDARSWMIRASPRPDRSEQDQRGRLYRRRHLRVGRSKNTSVLHGFSLIKGTWRLIDFPGARLTSAEGINNSGVISGYFIDASGFAHGLTLRDD